MGKYSSSKGILAGGRLKTDGGGNKEGRDSEKVKRTEKKWVETNNIQLSTNICDQKVEGKKKKKAGIFLSLSLSFLSFKFCI